MPRPELGTMEKFLGSGASNFPGHFMTATGGGLTIEAVPVWKWLLR